MHPFLLGALGLGLGVAVVEPLAAQGNRSTHVSETVSGGRQHSNYILTDGDHSIAVVLDGTVQFTDDDADVAALGEGSTLVIDERRRGEPSRHIAFRGEDGTIRLSYTVNGVLSDDEPDRKAWLARLLPELIREQGFNAGPRVERILKREGPDGVLKEIRRIRSDGSKRAYLAILLRTAKLSPEQQVGALRIVEREISSDGNKSAVLRTIASDLPLDRTAVRVAYFAAASSISSDGGRRAVLVAVLPRAEGDPAALASLLALAAGINSDGDKTRVLLASATAPALETPAARDAWFTAAGSISSDGDRSRALRAVLSQRGEFAAQVLRSAREISSDGDKTRVLLAVAPDRLRDPQVAQAYDAALASISSSGDHRRAEMHGRAARTAER